MEVLTEMDEYFNAMSKINMDEPVMPYVKGRLVESDIYNKVQKILNTPELEKAHVYCYDLDLENLEECDVMKINNLYKLGVDRGFIDDDLQYQGDTPESPTADVAAPPPEEPVQPALKPKVPCFVAMYSAMKDGQIKTGEAYSRAISVEAAKADVRAQLSKFGYTNISILAVEATEEDACCSSPVSQIQEDAVGSALASGIASGIGQSIGQSVGPALAAGGAALAGGAAGAALASDDKTNENDILKGRVHNGHLPEAEEDQDDSNNSEDEEEPAPDFNIGDDAEDDSEDDSTEDDSSAEENSADDEDDSTDDEGTEDSEADNTSDEETSDDEGSEDDSEDDSTEDDSTEDDSEDDAEDDAEDVEDDSEDDEESEEEDSDDSDDSEEEELDDNKKADLKDNYKKIFKNTMLKCKFEDKSFDDLTLKEKVKFFTELSKTWKEKYEPTAFMSDKEIDQLNKVVIKK